MSEAQSHERFDKAVRELRDAGRALWLAGLGAVAEVEEESRVVLDQWIDRMAEKGRSVDERQRKALDELGERTGSTVREMKKLFEDTVEYESKTLLKRLGLMTREDVQVLATRIDTLAAKVDELVARHELPAAEVFEAAPPAAPKAPARRPRQRKS
ncbi:MAG TPA: hypothetical protein DD490_07715 [Acidobacteria bacterium]|nr:hypothetical protein [Acidobacteriota bacterium]